MTAEIVETLDVEPVRHLPAAPTPAPAISLFGSTDPSQVVERATVVATALRDVVTKRRLVSTIRGREHPQVEAWTLLGSMLGVFPVTTWTRPITDNAGKAGWEARVEARTLGGALVGAAEAMCARGEATWAGRDDHALRSMAATRATSKALRLPLGFVMQLAGWSATPAEEMDGDDTPRASSSAPAQDEQRAAARSVSDFGLCEEPGCPGRLIVRTVKAKGTPTQIVDCSERGYTDRRSGEHRGGTCQRETDWSPDWEHYSAHKERHDPAPVQTQGAVPSTESALSPGESVAEAVEPSLAKETGSGPAAAPLSPRTNAPVQGTRDGVDEARPGGSAPSGQSRDALVSEAYTLMSGLSRKGRELFHDDYPNSQPFSSFVSRLESDDAARRVVAKLRKIAKEHSK